MRKTLLLIIILNFQFSILNLLHAQRDWELTEQRNPWLTSRNAAALTTFADSSISKGTVSYAYEGGGYRGASDGKEEMTLKADARSYYRLSKDVMAYGSFTYTNFSGTDMSGSMMVNGYGLTVNGYGLMPFDLLQGKEDAGRKHLDLFNVVGGFGWNVWKGLSVGAKADFSAGNYAKYKDLRHGNTLMNLNTLASVFYKWNTKRTDTQTSPLQGGLGGLSIGASFIYNRCTESVKYKTYGTTDHIYNVLLDYANHQGETLTYGGDGFIDDNTELPLFDERCGMAVQGSLGVVQGLELFAGFSYLHRHGYYGQQTQYTASYEKHDGNGYEWNVRLGLPQTKNRLSWIDFKMTSEGLTSYKTNFRQVKSEANSSVTYYEYYEPTKMSDKVLHSGTVGYTAYIKPLKPSEPSLNPSEPSLKPSETSLKPSEPSLYKWQLNAGMGFIYSKQTAYLYPEMITRRVSLWMPYIKGKRNVMFRNTGVLGIEFGLSVQCGDMDIEMDGIGSQLAQSVAVGYEFPFKGVRPKVSLGYTCAEACDGCLADDFRQNAMLSVGVMF